MDESQGVGGQRGAQVMHSSSVKIEQDDEVEDRSDIDTPHSSNNA